MLLFNENAIVETLALRKWVEMMEEAILLANSNDYLMPPRPHFEYNNNTLLLMPAFTKKYFATKLVSVNPANPSKNLPAIYGSVILNNGETGQPIAIFEGSKLTAMRTGAVGGLAIKYLADKKASTVGLIGAGVQGLHQLIFSCNQRSINDVIIFDKFKISPEFVGNLIDVHPHLRVRFAESADDLIQKSDIIITATTSEEPVFNGNIDFKNKTFIAIGSYKPNMQELPSELLNQAEYIFTDTLHAIKESGDLKIPIEKNELNPEAILSLSELIEENVILNKNKPKVFKGVGMALFDLVAAKSIFEHALSHNMGQKVEL